MTEQRWDFQYQPRKLRIAVIVLAVLIMIAHIAWAATLLNGDTGVTLAGGDQAAFVVIGIILSCLVLLLLRVRVRAGATGIELRGPLRTRVWPWAEVVGFTFPRSSQWPRLELPAYEHVGILAVQASDGDAAIEAMGELRKVAGRYKPSAADPDSVADR